MLKNFYERLALLGFVLSACVGCDQTTKRLAEQNLQNGESHSFFFDSIRLNFILNPGAFLGLGADFDHTIKLIFFIILPILVLVGGIIFILFKSQLSSTQIIFAALVIGGGIGNLIDRIFLSGHVTDFLNIGIGSLRTGIFNIADVAIMIGACGFFLGELKKDSVKQAIPVQRE